MSSSFIIRHKSTSEIFQNIIYIAFSFCQNIFFCGRYNCIANGNCNCTFCGIFIPLSLDIVKNFCGFLSSMNFNARIYYISELFFAYQEINFELTFVFGDCSVYIAQILRYWLIKYDSSGRGFY